MHDDIEKDRPRRDPLIALLGDTPGKVAVRLIVMSLIVGFGLTVFGLTPVDLFRSVERLVRDAWENSADLLRAIVSYILTGAVVVVPIWVLMRVMAAGRRRR